MSVSHTGHHGEDRIRQGDCHRCGWNLPLHKVSGELAGVSRRGEGSFRRPGARWLCDECISDLTPVVQAGGGQRGSEGVRLVSSPARRRSVA